MQPTDTQVVAERIAVVLREHTATEGGCACGWRHPSEVAAESADRRDRDDWAAHAGQAAAGGLLAVGLRARRT